MRVVHCTMYNSLFTMFYDSEANDDDFGSAMFDNNNRIYINN
jgi:hypothetical protein